jgi:hypothetical protein
VDAYATPIWPFVLAVVVIALLAWHFRRDEGPRA